MNFLCKLFLRTLIISSFSIVLYGMDADSKKTKELNIAQQAAVGAGMGAMDAIVSTPLTYCKNTIQAGKPLSRNPKDYFTGFLTFAGTLTPIAQTQNVAYETLKNDCAVSSSVAAPAAGAIAAVIVNPIDLVLRHVQTDQDASQTAKKASTLKTVRQLYAQYGVRCFTRGLGITMLRDCFYAEAYLEGMSRARKAIAQKTNNKRLQHLGTMGAGLAIGTAATLLTQPMDTIQGEMQKGKTSGSLGYRSTWQAIKLIPQAIDPRTGKRAGKKAFYKGTLSRLGLVSASILVLDGAKESFTAYATK